MDMKIGSRYVLKVYSNSYPDVVTLLSVDRRMSGVIKYLVSGYDFNLYCNEEQLYGIRRMKGIIGEVK